MQTNIIKPGGDKPPGKKQHLELLNSFAALRFSARHIVFIVFGVVVTKQCYQIGVVGFISCKVELAATLAAFLHSTVDEMLEKSFLVVAKDCGQILIILQILFVVINRCILCNLFLERFVLKRRTTISGADI